MDGKDAPRWEWRSFAAGFGPAADRLRATSPAGEQDSDEIYLLSPAADNVKLRDALLDVKVLQAVDAQGLECWRPVLKAAFPLSGEDAGRALDALRLPRPAVLPQGLTLDDFRAWLDVNTAGIRVVPVHKHRRRFIIDGCSAELSDIRVGARSFQTIAVESVDAAAVLRAVDQLGLSGHVNTSYPRALARLAAGGDDAFAVIDVGTNSVKFHIGARGADGCFSTVADRAEVTRLGEGLSATGRISAEAVGRTGAALSGMVAEAHRAGVVAIAAVGTAGLRIAANAADVVAALSAAAGVRIEVISGEDEARLAYLAARAGAGNVAGSLVVFDTGGGSSQFTFGSADQVSERFSVNVGAAHYTETFGLDRAVSLAELEHAFAAIRADLAVLRGRPRPDRLVGMGGAVTNLAAVSLGMTRYDPTRIHGAVLDVAEIDRQIALYRSRDAAARQDIAGLQPARAEVILAGACIVRSILHLLDCPALAVSDRGLRHGVLVERFGLPAPAGN